MVRKLFVLLVLGFAIVLAVISAIFYFLPSSDGCKCVKVQTTCCPCEMGGQEACVPAEEAENYPPKNCSSRQICAAVYNCKNVTCSCSGGKCSEN
jgi:hypothetical protein